MAQGLIDVKSLETDSQANVNLGSSSKNINNGGIPNLLGFGKGKKSTSSSLDSTGLKLKEQFLHPYFDKIRYTIGIRELVVAHYTFAETSEFISKPFASPKEIIKVHLTVDEYVPPQFDVNVAWIKYFVKPDSSDTWIPINAINAPTRFDTNGEIIPKIVNFNIPKPSIVATENKFNFTDTPVKQFRVRAIISRPVGTDFSSMTPLLKSYRLVMTPRAN